MSKDNRAKNIETIDRLPPVGEQVMDWWMLGPCCRAAAFVGVDSFVLGMVAGAALMLCGVWAYYSPA